MDQRTSPTPPYFDSESLRRELTALAKEHGANSTKLRPALLNRLKACYQDARQQAEDNLKVDGLGRKCAEGLSLFQDELIRVIYDFTIHHAYPVKNPSSAEHMSIIATGGYGRGLLAPGSDIDLLFLLPYKQTAWGESVVEFTLYLLWDLGFKVGHATRNVPQCVNLSKSDMTIRTAMLDARFIWGDETIFDEFKERFHKDVLSGSPRNFVDAKLEERDSRHNRSGSSRYLVEPNIKDGKGGLRDIHTLHWLATYLTDFGEKIDLVQAGVFTPNEYHAYRKAEDFLWTVRCHLHFLAGRAEERLTFDVQPAMAERLGYTNRGGMSAVERFMRHYFLVAKDVGDLTRIVCLALEIKNLKPVPGLNNWFKKLSWTRRDKLEDIKDFKIENGRMTVKNDAVFKKDPVNLIRLFSHAKSYGTFLHPDAFRLIRGSFRLIDNDLRENKTANEIFLNILTDETDPEPTLRSMNEAGVLGRFIPDFGRIVSMMQFNMYHHYTVDEHLLRAIGILHDIDNGEASEEHPLASEVMPTIKNRRALYVAVFLHDIAKGRDEDHSVAGMKVARELCPRLGLTRAETETVAWLVEHHLVMSQIAQSRDIYDPKTIEDFAAIVQSPERLKLLLILTVADIRAVGPGVWNGWKGQLLRALYYQTEPYVTGGHSKIDHQERIDEAQKLLRKKLPDWSDEKFDRYIARHTKAYWLRTSINHQHSHATLIDRADNSGEPLTTEFATDDFRAVTTLTIFASNHSRLLAMVTGACAAAGANIVDAIITTTTDNMALDTIFLQRQFEQDDDEERRANKIFETIEKLMSEEISLQSLVVSNRPSTGKISAFTVEPDVVVDNTLSNELTVIEIHGLDRPGLLFDLTRTISELELDISSALIATFGEKAVDVFYVTDFNGQKIIDHARQEQITNRIIDVLEEKQAVTV